MKMVLNHELKSEVIIDVDESTSEDYTKSKEMEEMLSQDLENIEESIKLLPEFSIENYVDKGKRVILEFQEGTSLNPTQNLTKDRMCKWSNSEAES